MTQNKQFDPTKPVQTRDGKAVRILFTKMLDDKRPIVALITREDGKESLTKHTELGNRWSNCSSSPNDLINVPVKKKGWINIYTKERYGSNFPYDTTGQTIFPTREEALKYNTKSIACKEIEYEEGEGLDET